MDAPALCNMIKCQCKMSDTPVATWLPWLLPFPWQAIAGGKRVAGRGPFVAIRVTHSNNIQQYYHPPSTSIANNSFAIFNIRLESLGCCGSIRLGHHWRDLTSARPAWSSGKTSKTNAVLLQTSSRNRHTRAPFSAWGSLDFNKRPGNARTHTHAGRRRPNHNKNWILVPWQKRTLPRQKKCMVPTKNDAVASGNGFSIVCITIRTKSMIRTFKFPLARSLHCVPFILACNPSFGCPSLLYSHKRRTLLRNSVSGPIYQ